MPNLLLVSLVNQCIPTSTCLVFMWLAMTSLLYVKMKKEHTQGDHQKQIKSWKKVLLYWVLHDWLSSNMKHPTSPCTQKHCGLVFCVSTSENSTRKALYTHSCIFGGLYCLFASCTSYTTRSTTTWSVISRLLHKCKWAGNGVRRNDLIGQNWYHHYSQFFNLIWNHS